MEKNPGSKNVGGNKMLPPVKLDSLGITKMQSSRWRSAYPAYVVGEENRVCGDGCLVLEKHRTHLYLVTTHFE
jgi:hypothetical protein